MYRCKVFVVVAFLVAACAHPVEEGEEALEAGDYQQALEVAERAVEEDGDARAHLLYGRVLVEKDDYDDAVPHLKEAVESDETGVDAAVLLGDVLGQVERRPVERARAYRQALDVEPGVVDESTYLEALEAVVQKPVEVWKQDERLWARHEIRRLDPEHEEATDEEIAGQKVAVARIRAADGEIDEAVELMEAALELHSDDGWSFKLGDLHLRKGDRARALEAWEPIFSELDDQRGSYGYGTVGDPRRTVLNLAAVARYRGGRDLAVALLRAGSGLEDEQPVEVDIPALEDPGELALRLGILELFSGHIEAADEAFRGYLRAGVDGNRDLEAVARVVDLLKWADAPEYALDILEELPRYTDEEFVDIDSELVEFHATQHLEAGDEEAAYGAVETWIDLVLDRQFPDGHYDQLLRLVEVAVDVDRPQWGPRLLEAFRDHPDQGDEPDLEELGEYVRLVGHPEYVRDVLDEIEEMDDHRIVIGRDRSPEPEDVDRFVAELLRDVEMFDDALEYARRATEKQRDLTNVELLAAIYFDRGEDGEALELWRDVATDPETTDQSVRSGGASMIGDRLGVDAVFDFYEHLAEAGYDDNWSHLGRYEQRRGQGRPEEALDHLEEYLEVSDDLDEVFDEVRDELSDLGGDGVFNWADGCRLETDEMPQIRSRVRALLGELIERRLDEEPGDVELYRQLSDLYVADGRLEEAVQVLEDYIDGRDVADAAKRDLVEHIGEPDEDLDPRPLLMLWQRRLEEGSNSAKLFLGETHYEYELQRRRSLGDGIAESVDADQRYGVDGTALAVRWFERFFEATEGARYVDDTEQEWSDLARRLGNSDIPELAVRAWERAERFDQEVDVGRRLAVALQAGLDGAGDHDFEALMESDELELDRRSRQRLVGALIEQGRLEDAGRLLERLKEEARHIAYPDDFVSRNRREVSARREEPDMWPEWVEGFGRTLRDRQLGETAEEVIRQEGNLEGLRAYFEQDHMSGTDRIRAGAEVDARRGDTRSAAEALAGVLDLLVAPSAGDWTAMAGIWSRAGDQQQARRHHDAALAWLDDEPFSTEVVVERMGFLAESGEIDAAMEDYEAIRELHPRGPELIVAGLFEILVDQGYDRQAAWIVDELGDYPELDERHRKTLQDWNGRTDRAPVDTDGMTDKEIEMARLQSRRTSDRIIEELLEAGRIDEAVEFIEHWFDRDPREVTRMVVDDYGDFGRLEDYDPTELIAECVEETNRQAPQLAGLLAELRVRTGQYDDAVSLLEVAADHGDGDAEARLAGLLFDRGDYDDGVERLRSAVGRPSLSKDLSKLVARVAESDDDVWLEEAATDPLLAPAVLPVLIDRQLDEEADDRRVVDAVEEAVDAIELDSHRGLEAGPRGIELFPELHRELATRHLLRQLGVDDEDGDVDRPRRVDDGKSTARHDGDIEEFVDTVDESSVGAAEVDAFVDEYEDRRAVRRGIVEEFVDRDWEQSARMAVVEAVEINPDVESLKWGMEVALQIGEADKFRTWFDDRRALAEDSGEFDREVATLLLDPPAGAEPEVIVEAARHLCEKSFGDLEVVATCGVAESRGGNLDAGVDRVVDFLEVRLPSAGSLDRLARIFADEDQHRLIVEAVIPFVEAGGDVWMDTIPLLVAAESTAGDDRRARELLALLEENSERIELRRIETAQRLIELGEYDVARQVVAPLEDAAFVDYTEALATLAEGDEEAAGGAVERLLETELDRRMVLPTAIGAVQLGGVDEYVEQLESRLDQLQNSHLCH